MDPKIPRPPMTLHKIVIMGEGGVGKTTITAMFVNEHFIECYDPTGPGEDRKQVFVDGKSDIIEILESGPLHEYQALREIFIKTGDCFALVFSLASRDSFTRVKPFYDEIKKHKELPVPLLLLGNKSDRCPEYRQVSTEEGEELAKELGCDYFETSAKLNTNITEAFHQLVRLNREKHQRESEAKEAEAREAERREKMNNSMGNKPGGKGWKKRLSGLFSRLRGNEKT